MQKLRLLIVAALLIAPLSASAKLGPVQTQQVQKLMEQSRKFRATLPGKPINRGVAQWARALAAEARKIAARSEAPYLTPAELQRLTRAYAQTRAVVHHRRFRDELVLDTWDEVVVKFGRLSRTARKMHQAAMAPPRPVVQPRPLAPPQPVVQPRPVQAPPRPALPIPYRFRGGINGQPVVFEGAGPLAVAKRCNSYMVAHRERVHVMNLGDRPFRPRRGSVKPAQVCALIGLNARPIRPVPNSGTLKATVEGMPIRLTGTMGRVQRAVRTLVPDVVRGVFVKNLTLHGVQFTKRHGFWRSDAVTAIILAEAPKAGRLEATGRIGSTPFRFVTDTTQQMQAECRRYLPEVGVRMVREVEVNGQVYRKRRGFYSAPQLCMAISSHARH